ncbi:CDP-glucose 4,6-dehydratase [Lacisediminimonas profundi]|uniref:CDP-glucose 4,6-dehydratase n=1 Tax=Lacisediminimonas profundi TaxID=2603856 RepID=UPI001F4F3D0F|nr:CDP-glucose 4,6-dehydratase [Lacisediminimonas profundi]
MGTMVMADALQAYRGKRVFITGHTGFKGSWLARILTQLGAEVTGYALPPATEDSHFERLGLRHQIQHIEGDIRDAGHLVEAVRACAPEYLFHLAAQALVKRSYSDPVETFSTNVMGSVHVLEAVRATPSIRSLVYITSDKCYENHEWIWGYRENDQLGGHDPYSASKAAAEIAFSAYSRSFLSQRGDLGAATTRAGNVIGGGDWAADRIVPDCVRAVAAGKEVLLRNPHATRPWQHVLEPLSGYLLLGACLHEDPKGYAGSWNFGPPSTQCRTVGEVAQTLVTRFGTGAVAVEKGVQQQHEAQLLQLNCDKAHQKLGWYPRWNIEQTLTATADWYKSVLDGEDASQVTGRQIREYFPEIN